MHPGIGKLMIVAACMFIFGFASTWAPGIWILIGETFPTRTRAKQGALATSSNWAWNFFLAFFTPFIVSAIGFQFGFVFAACNLLGAVVVAFFLYESGGLSLEAVDRMYNDTGITPWTSRKWARDPSKARTLVHDDMGEHRKLRASTAEKGATGDGAPTQRWVEDVERHSGESGSPERGEGLVRSAV